MDIIKKNYKDTYLITIDRKLIHEYHLEYMKKNPSVRTLPFTKPRIVKVFDKKGNPILTKGKKQKTKKVSVSKKDYTIDDCIYGTMSLNELLIINNRMTMNNKKEKWGELGAWIANKYKLNDLNISNCIMEYSIFSETKAKKDSDNICGGIKILNDGFLVKSHMCIDDNYTIVNPLLISCHFDKDHPRTEIRITTFDDNIRDIYDKLQIHIENFKNMNND